MTQHGQDWRELCAAVANERDLQKMFELTEQLIVALDERKPIHLPRPSTGMEAQELHERARRLARAPPGREIGATLRQSQAIEIPPSKPLNPYLFVAGHPLLRRTRPNSRPAFQLLPLTRTESGSELVRHHDRVDHVDHAIRLEDIRDRDQCGAPLLVLQLDVLGILR